MLALIISYLSSALDLLGLIILFVGAMHFAVELLTGRGMGGRGLILILSGIVICWFGNGHMLPNGRPSAERGSLSRGG